MNPKYERRDGEDVFEYGLRLIEMKIEQKPDDLDWEDIVEATGIDCHRDSLRKAASVTPYSGYAVAQYFKKKYASQCAPNQDSYMNELDCKIAEMRKETKRFYDQRREFHKMVDRIGREENLEDRLIEAANGLKDSIGSIDFNHSHDLNNDNEAILVLTDWHYGMTTNNVWNQYNTTVCKDRIKNIVENAANRIMLHRCSKLHIVVLGDLVHGSIHVSARVASEELVCNQIMQASEILAQCVEYLSKFVDKTIVYMTYGNHARTIQDKNDSLHADNLERLIPWWLEQRLRGSENVLVKNDFENEFLCFRVFDYGFCASHGDLDGAKNSTTALTTLFHKKYGYNVDYILLGDKHHRESYEQFGVISMVCDALCGSDDYANDRRLYSNPGQTLLIVSSASGLDAEYHLRCG